MEHREEAGPEGNLAAQLAPQVLAVIRDDGLSVGDRITERAMAERLRVSRSPVRKAFTQLCGSGALRKTETGRYEVAPLALQAPAESAASPHSVEAAYLRIAEDRLDEALPERVTEALLMRRYALTRPQVAEVLLRITAEGWIAPLPGRGWEFLPVFTTMQSYVDSFRFRLLVEPDAIMEPTFSVDRDLLLARRDEQVGLRSGGLATISAPELFDLNSKVHEAVARCSNNALIIDSVVRVNKLRRLVEYRQAVNRERAFELCGEHIELIDLLLMGEQEAAQTYLRQHLTTVRRAKTRDSDRLLDRGRTLS
ncbi:DNA-binding GntR family transcriptional regulator [Pseudoclavibacter sp. JAI123]|uniref:GntR family transcriptional regulator n=1 Tax=Pseudoclavibacter sp. JAI123 TaxID=2723065 RepID=UPI0015C7761E|nr:GntR family transcriptional regulator [Pseudoclavibacter sp. JAI123]NYF14812.1 DNA-binding GntR family transcriptional regulator [Pseudoclavibacter sp. JAI123]